MDKIHRHVREDFQVGDDTSGILKYLKLEENDEQIIHFNSDLHIRDFCKWLRCVYEQMHQTDKSSTPDRKKFSGITRQLHCSYIVSIASIEKLQ